MSTIQVYQFYREDWTMIASARAYNHDEALKIVDSPEISFSTDFDSYDWCE